MKVYVIVVEQPANYTEKYKFDSLASSISFAFSLGKIYGMTIIDAYEKEIEMEVGK